MSDEPNGGQRKSSGKSRRRRRRRRPDAKPGESPPKTDGRQPQPERRQEGADPAGGAGKTRSSSRRRRRRPAKRDGAAPQGQETRQAEGRQDARQGETGQQPGKTGSRKRGRRRRRKPRREDAAPGPPTAQPTEAAQTTGDGNALTFPDEQEWDLDEPTRPPPPEPALPGPEIADADDLVLALDLDDDAPAPEGQLRNVVQVRFRDRANVARHDAGQLSLEAGERVVAETEQGLSIGTVTCSSFRTMVKGSVPQLLRRVDANDMRQEARNAAREREAFDFCRERIRQRRLPMKLIRVEYLHGGNKAMFYFAAEHRVDFRELVKDLAQKLHTRIVMRQVGVRDEAKMTGGIGSCGMPLCCAGWLPKFEPVSIRMAKDQNLVLNPQKVSGQCGRLKCCLTYEQATYQEAKRRLPRPGKMVRTPDGEGKVLDVDVLRAIVKVGLGEGKVEHYGADQVEIIAPPQRGRQ